jgi:DUF4097 and DUF4098 domain-containing protein YvlB
MSEYTFATPAPIQVYVENASGDVELHCVETGQTQVVVRPRKERDRDTAERTSVHFDGGELRVEVPNKRFGQSSAVTVLITAPAGSRLEARVAAADVQCAGPMTGLEVKGASSDVVVEHVDGDVSVTLASGDVRAGTVTGLASIRTASGDLRLDDIGGLEATTASGDILIGSLNGRLEASSASGDVRVSDAAGGQFVVTTMSGDISVAVRPGTALRLDLSSRSGDVRSELPVDEVPPETGAALDLRLRSISGDVVVRRGSVPTPVS